MARKPDNTRGSLIFQEGKCIEGDFYIIAVYDDPGSCTISFSAYELENDSTYTYPLTYSEFDALFKFDSELMNPSNQDGRFHWVIERLDFVQDNRGQKVLCLAQEPTPEEDDEADLVEEKPKSQSIAPAAGGKIDAATRAKLLKELDTQDDAKLHVQLVKSEGARKRFLADLHQKRQLEQLKASQRLQKADEEREARLAKLDIIKKQQAEKALQHKQKEDAQKSTMAQLEVLMKQKEAQAIRRLIQEKDEQDRGMGREKDAARNRRKMQERSAAEVKAIEQTRANQLGRKRDDAVVIRERKIAQVDRGMAEKVREFQEDMRAIEVRRREEKDQMIEDLWTQKREERQETDRKKEKFEELEEVRDRITRGREDARAKDESRELEYRRAEDEKGQVVVDERRQRIRKEENLQWRVDASKRAILVRENSRREDRRTKKWVEKEDQRLRKFREEQFLDTLRGRTMSPKRTSDEKDEEEMEAEMDPRASMTQTATGGFVTKAEATQFQKSFEQEERQKRHAEREERKRQEEAKKGKLQDLKGKDPNAMEMLRIKQWRKEDGAKKDMMEKAKVAREVSQEEETRKQQAADLARQETWDKLTVDRTNRESERETSRNEACIQRTKGVMMGTGLPQGVLVF